MFKRATLLFPLLSACLSCQLVNASTTSLKSSKLYPEMNQPGRLAQGISRQKQVANDNKGLSLELQTCQKLAKKVICSLLITNRQDADTQIELRDPSFYNNAQ